MLLVLGRAEYYACAVTLAIAAKGAGVASALRSVTQSPFDQLAHHVAQRCVVAIVDARRVRFLGGDAGAIVLGVLDLDDRRAVVQSPAKLRDVGPLYPEPVAMQADFETGS